MHQRLVVNGEDREVDVAEGTTLLHVLRNHLGLRAAKFGCGEGLCGACTVWVDGHPTPSCDLPVEAVGDRPVRTLEGLGDGPTPHPLQEAFLRHQAAQCGYCTAGLLMRGAALLRDDPAPDRGAVCAGLDRHLCRCGSHQRVVAAVLDVAGGSV
jgi:nicotinate dehydrogenase subunit A